MEKRKRQFIKIDILSFIDSEEGRKKSKIFGASFWGWGGRER